MEGINYCLDVKINLFLSETPELKDSTKPEKATTLEGPAAANVEPEIGFRV